MNNSLILRNELVKYSQKSITRIHPFITFIIGFCIGSCYKERILYKNGSVYNVKD